MPTELLEPATSAPHPASHDTAPTPSDTVADGRRRFEQMLIDSNLVNPAFREPTADPEKAEADAVFEEAYAKSLEVQGVTASTPLTDEINKTATDAALEAVARFRDGDLPSKEAPPDAELAEDATDKPPVRPARWVSPYGPRKRPETPAAGSTGSQSGVSRINEWFKGGQPEEKPDAEVLETERLTTVAEEAAPVAANVPEGSLGERLAIAAEDLKEAYGANVVVTDPTATEQRPSAPSEDSRGGVVDATHPETGIHDAVTDTDLTQVLKPVGNGNDATMPLPVHYDNRPTQLLDLVDRGGDTQYSLLANLFGGAVDAEYLEDARNAVRYRRVAGFVRNAGRTLGRVFGLGSTPEADSSFLPRGTVVAQPISYDGGSRGMVYPLGSAGRPRRREPRVIV